MKKIILFIILCICSNNVIHAFGDDDNFILQLKDCNILNGLNSNRPILNYSYIAIIENILNIKLTHENLQQKVIYGTDVKKDAIEISGHANDVCIILNQLVNNINFVFSRSCDEMKKYDCNIINMSCGMIDDNELLCQNTQKFLEKAFSKGPEKFITIIEKYNNPGQHDEEIKECISEGLADEYFLSKHLELIKELIKNKEFSDVNQFLKELSKTLTENFNTYRNFTTNFLNGDFLIIQALANGKGILSIDNCTFNNVETGSPERENIVFARNLYLSQEENYVTPEESEIPSENFANRTLCAVIPSNYDTDISFNSCAAPVVSACALMIESTLKQKELPTLLPSEIAQCLLKTAKRIFLASDNDKIEIDGEFFSKTYGAGIIQMDDAINLAINMAKKKQNLENNEAIEIIPKN